MKILILEDEEDVREIMALSIETKLDVEILETGKLSDAKSILDQNNDIFCVIADYHLPDGNGGEFYQYILEKKLETKFVLASVESATELPELKEAKLAGTITKPYIIESLNEIIEKIFIPNADESELSDSEYCKIRIKTLFKGKVLKQDVYLKLSESKYIKVMKDGDPFDENDLKRYKSRDLTYLYIKKDDVGDFINSLTKDVQAIVDKTDISYDDAFELTKTLHESISEISQAMGFTKDVQDLTKVSVKMAVQTIKLHPQLAQLFAKLLADREKYLHSHSVLLSHLSCGLATMMSWQSESTLYKLSLASFLHDITITNHELGAIKSLEDLEANKDKFTEEEIMQWKSHPSGVSELIEDFEEIPLDVDSIISQHHERPDGTGFPRKMNHTRIGPLSSLFIVSHDIVSYIFDHPDDLDLVNYLNEASERFNAGHFAEIWNTIKDSVVSKALK